jgi:hypothetical protein
MVEIIVLGKFLAVAMKGFLDVLDGHTVKCGPISNVTTGWPWYVHCSIWVLLMVIRLGMAPLGRFVVQMGGEGG